MKPETWLGEVLTEMTSGQVGQDQVQPEERGGATGSHTEEGSTLRRARWYPVCTASGYRD